MGQVKMSPVHAADPSRLIVLVMLALGFSWLGDTLPRLVGPDTGFFGVGGGFVVVPALVLALGFSMPVAVGTSLVVIAVNSVTALASRVVSGVGALDWAVIVVFAAAAVAGSLMGGKLTERANPRHLTAGFAVMLLAVDGYTALASWGLG